MSKRGDAKSLALDVYQQIRQNIFDGQYQPGTRLAPALLAAEYGASTTVLREAMILLSADRLVVSTPGHGFSVPSLKREELHDLTLLRCHNEALALELAIARGGLEWESDVISAHHKMTRIPRRKPENPEVPNPEWFNAHRAFHSKLLAGCGIPALIDICEKLSSATEIYRVYSVPITKSLKRDVETEHAQILAAVLEHDAARAVALLKAHFEGTEQSLLAHWPSETP